MSMNRRGIAFALMLGGAVFGEDLHFKTRTVQLSAQADAGADITDTTSVHKIIQYDHSPGIEDLDSLLQDGLTVVAALPDNAVVVAAPGGRIPPGPDGKRPGVSWIGTILPEDKLSPALMLVEMADDDVATVVVEFHSDLTPDQQDTVAGAEGVTFQRTTPLRRNHVLVIATADEIVALAQHDEVAYIFPADPALLSGNDLIACAGMLTANGTVGQYANIVHGWNLDSDNAAHLGYAFGSITPKVPALLVQSEMVRALNEWAKHTNVIFQPATVASAPRTVLMKFVSGAHGDAYPFDGPGGILAHTFYPVPINAESIAGDMHLDADENWHAGGDIDIYSVALHEAGHAIGLGHSDKPGDVMYPYYRSNMSLSANDIGAARTMYGPLNSSAPVSSGTAPTAPTTPAPTISPLQLTLDSIPLTTQVPASGLSGTVAGGSPPYSVQWQTDHGYSGKAAFQNNSPTAWTAGGISLVSGGNTLTVTAFDSQQRSASKSTSVTLQSAAPTSSTGSLPIGIRISSPVSSVSTVSATTLTASGTASGGTGVNRVTWQTAAGASGTANGTDHWTAAGIPLLTGNNTVIIRAWDAAGASAWASLLAVRH